LLSERPAVFGNVTAVTTGVSDGSNDKQYDGAKLPGPLRQTTMFGVKDLKIRR
jgi:hypothetical protein